MLIEIHGTGTHNRGAELMAIAISTRLREVDPAVRIAVDARFGTFEERARCQFRTLNSFSIRTASRWFGELAPRTFRETLGLVTHSDVDALLDASGFAFSDQWGVRPAECLSRDVRLHLRRNQPLIFLPQAFGPFKKPEVARACRELFERATLIFARDPDSYAAVQALGHWSNRLKLCPDFTLLSHGRPQTTLEDGPRFGAVVPNYRMLDKMEDQAGEVYLRFLSRAVTAFRRQNLKPLVVLHDKHEDRRLLPRLFKLTGELPVFESTDPLVLKGALGLAHVVVGSRFHALVGSLSQAVPCIGAGWSHKYKWLFHDFGCPDCLVDLSDLNRLDQLVEEVCSMSAREKVVRTLRKQTLKQREQVAQMWAEVECSLGIGRAERKPHQLHEMQDSLRVGSG